MQVRLAATAEPINHLLFHESSSVSLTNKETDVTRRTSAEPVNPCVRPYFIQALETVVSKVDLLTRSKAPTSSNATTTNSFHFPPSH